MSIGLLAVVAVQAGGPRAWAAVRLASVFDDHMMLQRDRAVPVWGKADPGEEVTVAFGGQRVTATADDRGDWRVNLAPMPANATPQTLTVSGKNELKVEDVLLGDVWLCAGQSNMQFPLNKSLTAAKGAVEPQPDLPQLRIFSMKPNYALEPAETARCTWQPCTPETTLKYPATAYYFGQYLQQQTGVPIGLLTVAIGGTRVECWLPAASFERVEALDAEELAAVDPAGKLTFATPTGIYNGMLHPLGPFAVKGALWYQGESNVLQGDTLNYADKLLEFVRVLREQLERPDLPFYYVQLPPHTYTKSPYLKPGAPVNDQTLGLFRDTQRRLLKQIDHSAMAVIDDTIGNSARAGNIHPRTKDVVGYRLALIALAKDYGKDVVYSGPLYRSMEIKGNQIVLSFDHTEGGLALARGKQLDQFLIAGPDRQFVPAQAKIDGDTVIVWSPEVSEPQAVRFAWPETALSDLVNGHRLFAATFRTDDW